MDVVATHERTPYQEVIRDKRGVVIGRIEHQKLTGKSLARDVRGRLLGSYNPQEGLTRDASGKVIAGATSSPG